MRFDRSSETLCSLFFNSSFSLPKVWFCFRSLSLSVILNGFQNMQVQDKRRIRHLRLECTKARLHSSVVLSAHSHQYLYTVLNIFRTASLVISTSRSRHHYQNAVQLFRCQLDEVRKTGKYVISTKKIRSPNIPIIYSHFFMFTYSCETTQSFTAGNT